MLRKLTIPRMSTYMMNYAVLLGLVKLVLPRVSPETSSDT